LVVLIRNQKERKGVRRRAVEALVRLSPGRAEALRVDGTVPRVLVVRMLGLLRGAQGVLALAADPEAKRTTRILALEFAREMGDVEPGTEEDFLLAQLPGKHMGSSAGSG
jgi:hypothetical protein